MSFEWASHCRFKIIAMIDSSTRITTKILTIVVDLISKIPRLLDCKIYKMIQSLHLLHKKKLKVLKGVSKYLEKLGQMIGKIRLMLYRSLVIKKSYNSTTFEDIINLFYEENKGE